MFKAVFLAENGQTLRIILVAAALLALAACEGAVVEEDMRIENYETVTGPRETIFGEGRSISDVFSGAGSAPGVQSGAGLGVNAYLWRASLDTVSIWPINSADPFGGVILTDWYAPPESPNERFKMNVFILDRALRADGVRVSVFRQVRDRSGNWRDAPVQTTSAVKMENAILTRARQFRNETLQK